MTKIEGKKEKKPQLSQRELEVAAYYNWLNRGCPNGDSLTDWVEVEKHWDGKSGSNVSKKKA